MRAPARAGEIRPRTTGTRTLAPRAARARAVAPPVEAAPGAAVAPFCVVAAGVGGAAGERAPVAVIVVKNAQVSNSPKRARSCGPVTSVRPREPTISARTIRGDVPR